jgi:hypothetical protein
VLYTRGVDVMAVPSLVASPELAAVSEITLNRDVSQTFSGPLAGPLSALGPPALFDDDHNDCHAVWTQVDGDRLFTLTVSGNAVSAIRGPETSSATPPPRPAPTS